MIRGDGSTIVVVLMLLLQRILILSLTVEVLCWTRFSQMTTRTPGGVTPQDDKTPG